MRDCGLILLAAGASTRLGQPKQLLAFDGKTLLRRAAETALASSCIPIVAVFGADAERMAEELDGLAVTTIHNPDWEQGMGTSLRCGLSALPPGLSAVVVMVCDQPLLTSSVLNALVAAHCELGAGIVGSEYGGTAGVPALFGHAYLAELASLPPSEGARSVLKRHQKDVYRVPFPGGEIDIDTADDYATLMNDGPSPSQTLPASRSGRSKE